MFDCDLERMRPSGRYIGKLSDVLNDLVLGSSADEGVLKSRNLVLGASRLVRGTMEYKIKNPSADAVSLVNSSVRAALGVYCGYNIEGVVENFKQYLEKINSLDVLDEVVNHKVDPVSWWASSGKFSNQSAKYLMDELEGKDAFFLLIGHGGVMSGLDVFLRYRKFSGSNGSIAYPVRFSMEKCGDIFPKVDGWELSYLGFASKDKPVVIFDEDISTGETISEADKFFERTFARDAVTLRANSNAKMFDESI